jgi:hypothetical protein
MFQTFNGRRRNTNYQNSLASMRPTSGIERTKRDDM